MRNNRVAAKTHEGTHAVRLCINDRVVQIARGNPARGGWPKRTTAYAKCLGALPFRQQLGCIDAIARLAIVNNLSALGIKAACQGIQSRNRALTISCVAVLAQPRPRSV